jgi:ferritin-like metal-binding protein YciE
MIAEEADIEVKDAGLIAAAQRVEHYEMAGYGTARTYAELLGDKEGAQLLALTLEEERHTHQKLSELAKSAVNVAADKSVSIAGRAVISERKWTFCLKLHLRK